MPSANASRTPSNPSPGTRSALKRGERDAPSAPAPASRPSWFGRMRRAVRAFFKHDLKLRRDRGRVLIVLETPEEPARARPLSKPEKAAQKEQQELAMARQELAALLDEDARLRSNFRHLAFVEQALEKKGWRGLYKVPLDVLQKALQQLEALVSNWSPAGLAALRSKMAVAAIDREHNNPEAEADAYRTAAVLDNPQAVAVQVINDARAAAAVSAAADQQAAGDSIGEDEDAALRAAYEALGVVGESPAAVEVQPELGKRHAAPPRR
jgi:hypothetical protein